LKSLSEVIKAQGTAMDAYCVQNRARPLLSYGAKGTRVGRKTFLFAAALRQWEHLHEQMDLVEAYKKAKKNFTGKMEQLFVVLKEGVEIDDLAAGTGANRVAVGAKRPRMDNAGNPPKKS